MFWFCNFSGSNLRCNFPDSFTMHLTSLTVYLRYKVSIQGTNTIKNESHSDSDIFPFEIIFPISAFIRIALPPQPVYQTLLFWDVTKVTSLFCACNPSCSNLAFFKFGSWILCSIYVSNETHYYKILNTAWQPAGVSYPQLFLLSNTQF